MKKIIPGVLAAMLLLSLCGCKIERKDPAKIKDLEFTIVEEPDLPDELRTIIKEKKQAAFKITYTDQNALYIAVGYGAQATGGYSISVNELYLTANAIFIKTNLIGPGREEKISAARSFPYVVVKTELLDESVVFE